MNSTASQRMTNYRWVICSMLWLALVVNYLDRQVLSLTWKNFIAPEFNWTDADYGLITGVFSIVYAIAMLLTGRFVDKVGTKRGYLWAVGVWSAGACLHGLCGILTDGIVTGQWTLSFSVAREHLQAVSDISGMALAITSVSVCLFVAARCILSLGEGGNFPCSIKATAEYFPKKDRGFATGIFNSGAQIGPLVAPFLIPTLADRYGWEAAFILIGALGFLWMGAWVFTYKKPDENPRVNAAELDYIEQDARIDASIEKKEVTDGEVKAKKISFFLPFTYRQTWAVIFGRFLPDSVWWFLLFWAPAFINDIYGYSSASFTGMMAVFTIYLISMLSLWASYLPTYFIEKNRLNPYAGRMKALLIYAIFPILGIGVMPLGEISLWFPVVIIGIMAAAHQSWSANVFTVISDMFPKHVIASVTGAAGLASGLGSFSSNYGAGQLFVYAERVGLHFLGFEGKNAGYMIVFFIAGFAYLLSWVIMKILVPRYKLVVLK